MQRRHCLSGVVSASDDVVQKVDSDGCPSAKRRKLSSLIETPKVPSVAEQLTYEPHQTAALPPRQSAAPPQYQSVSLPACRSDSLPSSASRSVPTSRHSLRTRRSLPSSLHHHHHHHPSSVADGGRLSDRVSTRHMSAGRPPTLTRSRSDVTRDRLMSSVDSYSMSRGLHHNMPDAAAAYLPTSVYSTTPPSLYQSTIPPPHPPYLPSSAPVTSSELACYVVPTNSYLTPPSQWPTQSGISVVPAAVLAADVLPEYYYGMNSGTAFPVSGPAVYHHHQQQHQQQHHPSSSLHQHESTSDHATHYNERRHGVNSNRNMSYHLTQLAGDMTQIHRVPPPPPLYQPVTGSDAMPRHSAQLRDWTMLTRSSEHAQPLFVHHFLSMLESTIGMSRASPSLSYTSPHFHNYEALLGLARQLSESKPKGMCKSDIGRLASFQFSDSAVKQSSDEGEGAVTQTSCVVCMSEFINRQRIRELPCQHMFHLKCIDKWLKTNRTCPLCRSDVLNLLNSDTKPFIH